MMPTVQVEKRQLIDQFIARLQSVFSVDLLADLLSRLILALVVFSVVMLTWIIINRFVSHRLKRRVDSTTAAMLQTLTKTAFISLGLLAGLNAAGVQTGTLLASAGVLSLTVGFALKDTLSNIVSGFLIFMDRPFTIDDLVEIDGQYGRVDRITLRTTRIVTKDGRMLAVPNASVMNKTIASYTNFPHQRIDVRVTIAVTEDIERVRSILLDLVRHDPSYLKEPAPRMVVVEINDYNLAIELQAWLDDERQHIEKRFALREAAFKALVAANIEMPLETIQLAPHKIEVNKSLLPTESNT